MFGIFGNWGTGHSSEFRNSQFLNMNPVDFLARFVDTDPCMFVPTRSSRINEEISWTFLNGKSWWCTSSSHEVNWSKYIQYHKTILSDGREYHDLGTDFALSLPLDNCQITLFGKELAWESVKFVPHPKQSSVPLWAPWGTVRLSRRTCHRLLPLPANPRRINRTHPARIIVHYRIETPVY